MDISSQHFNKLPFKPVLLPLFRHFCRIDDFYDIQNQFLSRPHDIGCPFTALMELLDIKCIVSDVDLGQVPRVGPSIVVANHPTGILDAIVLASVLRRVRSDIRIVANPLALLLPGSEYLRDLFIFIEPAKTFLSSPQHSQSGLRKSIEWLRGGGLLALFPAAKVAHFDFRTLRISEPPWKTSVSRLAISTKSAVVPAFLTGVNSLSFQLFGLIHKRLRTLRLLHEFLSKKGTTVTVRIGSSVSAESICSTDPIGLTAYLRSRVFALGAGLHKRAIGLNPSAVRKVTAPTLHSRTEILDELNRLSVQNILIKSGAHVCALAPAKQIPQTLGEITRLRKISFEQSPFSVARENVGLTDVDENREHLFVWNQADRRILGAYRVLRTDETVSCGNTADLYASNFFEIDPGLFRVLGPGVELGAGFVRHEVKRCFIPLVLLWRGLARFFILNRRYSWLFGLQRFSEKREPLCVDLILRFLLLRRVSSALAQYVHPKRVWECPSTYVATAKQLMVPREIDQLVTLVGDIDDRPEAFPALLRMYLRMGASTLSAAADPTSRDLMVLLLLDINKNRSALRKWFSTNDFGNF